MNNAAVNMGVQISLQEPFSSKKKTTKNLSVLLDIYPEEAFIAGSYTNSIFKV